MISVLAPKMVGEGKVYECSTVEVTFSFSTLQFTSPYFYLKWKEQGDIPSSVVERI